MLLAAFCQLPAVASASEVAALLTEGERLLLSPVPAPTTRAQLQVRIAHRLPKHVLRRVTLSIDDSASVDYEYSDAQTQSLAAGAVQTLVEWPLPPGAHRLKATFSAREDNGSAIAPRVERNLLQTVTVVPGKQAVQLTLVGEGLFSQPQLQLVSIDDAAAPGLSEAQFQLASGQPYAAMVGLQAQRASSTEAQWTLAQARRQLGLHAAAAPGSAASGSAVVADTGRLLRYNQALAQARAGQDAAALVTLEQLAGEDAQGEEALAVRDLAWLTLGYRALHLRDPNRAADSFKRIRSPGPYAEEGLLGLGWAYLAPAQAPPAAGLSPLWPVRGDDSESARKSAPFADATAVADGKRAKALQEALVPWSELIGGDALSPPVQEALLTLPYVMTHLGAQAQARSYYERAIATLEQTHANLLAAQIHLRSGRLIDAMFAGTPSGQGETQDAALETEADAAQVPVQGSVQADEDWHWHIAALQYAPESAYLHPLLQDAELSAGMADLHHLHSMIRLLDRRRVRLSAAGMTDDTAPLRQRAEKQAARLAAQWQQQAQQRLVALQRRTDDYLAEAHFALAGFYDRGAPDAGTVSLEAAQAIAESGS